MCAHLGHIPQAQARTILFKASRVPSVMTCLCARNAKKDGLLPRQEAPYLESKKKFPPKARSIIRIGTSPTLRKHPKSSYEKFADKVRRKGQVRVLDGGKRCWEGSVVRIAGIPSVYKYNSISSIKPDSQITGKR